MPPRLRRMSSCRTPALSTSFRLIWRTAPQGDTARTSFLVGRQGVVIALLGKANCPDLGSNSRDISLVITSFITSDRCRCLCCMVVQRNGSWWRESVSYRLWKGE